MLLRNVQVNPTPNLNTQFPTNIVDIEVKMALVHKIYIV